MIRGTTPENSFTLPFDPPVGTEIRIVYAQGEEGKEDILFEKTTKDCTIKNKTVTVLLQAEETLLFDETPHWQENGLRPYPVKIQVGLRTVDGEVLWSDIIETTPGRCLKRDGVV